MCMLVVRGFVCLCVCVRVGGGRYGWHFPEMGKIVTENVPYAKAVKIMGMRTACATSDFRQDTMP